MVDYNHRLNVAKDFIKNTEDISKENKNHFSSYL